MMQFDLALAAHLESGATTTCHAWAIARRDGIVMGFTDHDCPLNFEGITFRAQSGMAAKALQQGTGLSVDNSEVIGALSDSAIAEADIVAGRYDNAEVRAWLVNWANPDERQIVFRGSFGELTRAGGAFRAELRGLSEHLNHPMGRVYQKPCAAVLGDAKCGFDTDDPSVRCDTAIVSIEGLQRVFFSNLGTYTVGWFGRGMLEVLTGTAAGLIAPVKRDLEEAGSRVLELWTPLAVDPGPGALVRLTAGCDKRFETCRDKFSNVINFQGFPDIPGDDWLMVQPGQSANTDGGSLR